MNPTRDEPVITAQTVATLVQILSLLTAVGVIHLTPEQFHMAEQVIAGVVTLLAPVVAAWWARSRVVPETKVKEIRDTAYLRGQDSVRMAKAPLHVDR